VFSENIAVFNVLLMKHFIFVYGEHVFVQGCVFL